MPGDGHEFGTAGEIEMFMRTRLAILAAATALTLTVGGHSTYAAEGKSMSGKWLLPDGSVLTIRGSEWNHQSRGLATIRRGAGNTIRVSYNSHQGTGCSYRVNTIANGDILVLETADATQSPDFCPSGRLSRAD
jgi:hypothetical protein